MFTKSWRAALCAIMATTVGLSLFATNATAANLKVRLGAQTISAYVAAYLAEEYGIYKKYGLDVTMQPITISTLAAASQMSHSLDLATMTVPDTVQAVTNGIDLVAITGVSVLPKEGGTQAGVLVQPNITINSAKDFVGKKMGISAIGSLLDILFRDYLMEGGVNVRKVNEVEIPIPSHYDVMKSRSVDGVVSADPMLSRIVATGVGKEVVNFGKMVPPDTLAAIVTSTRSYANKHPEVITRFRKAWADATQMALDHPDRVRTAMTKYLKMPKPVAATMKLPMALTTKMTVAQFQWWQNLMLKEHLLSHKVDLSNVIFH